MFVAGDVHVHWHSRFITAGVLLHLSLTHCDKMQNAVKRKAEEKKDRKEEAVII